MTSRFFCLRARLAGLLASFAAITPFAVASAQSASYPAISDVDPATALSRYLRMLAANPRDLASLTGAGRAALAVGDANAALGFYARAEEIAPRNGRIKAGLASALVQMEQPRAALKLFDEAVALGVPPGEVASDRGLAHDLNGDGRRAQADYTVALRVREDDETVRRLALSMAISGDRDGALAILSPLLARRDGGAQRARAFVLALTGDQAGAATAVRTAMPGTQAAAMTGFMGRLVTLNPAQKALAVNFGYFPSDGRAYTAAELFADARRQPLPSSSALIGARDSRADTPLIPAGEALGPRLASNDAVSVAPRRRPGQEDEVLPPPHVLSAPVPGVTQPVGRQAALAARQGTAEGAVAPAPSTPSSTAAGVPAPGFSSLTDARVAQPTGGSVAARAGATAVPAIGGPAPGYVPSGVSGQGAPAPAYARPSYPAGIAGMLSATTRPMVAEASAPATIGQAPRPGQQTPAPAGYAAGMPVSPAASPYAPAAPTRIATVALPAGATAAAPAPVRPRPAIEPVQPLAAPPARISPTVRASAGDRMAGAAGGGVRVTGTSRVARAASFGRTDEKAEGSGKETSKGEKATRVAALDPKTRRPLSSREKAGEEKEMAGGRKEPAGRSGITAKGKTTDAAKSKDAAGGKSVAKGKEAKGATTAKADVGKDKPEKSAAKDRKDAKADAKPSTPERYWVQVASGSNKDNLDRAWSAVKGKAPKQLSGQSTYTAPWRASNRLLIGPFKSAEEAQGKVNALAKAGVSGIQFTTKAGADVEKVATK